MPWLHGALWLPVLCWLLPAVVAAETLPLGSPCRRRSISPPPPARGWLWRPGLGQSPGFIAVADDATAASHNPAGLVQLERPEVSIVGSYFLRLERQDMTRPDTDLADQNLDAFNLNYLSAVYPFGSCDATSWCPSTFSASSICTAPPMLRAGF